MALFAPVYNQPNFSFDNLLALAQDAPHSESGLAYNPLTGQPAKGQYEYALTIHGLFIQDTWKVRDRLTLTYGLRWDDFGNPYPLNGTVLANFHLGPGQTPDQRIANGFMLQQSNVFNHAIANVFSPRAGFSWDPTGSGDWVVRGGFGVYHNWPTLGNDKNGLKGNPPGWIVPTFLSTGGTAPPIFGLGTTPSTPSGFPYPALPSTQLDSHGGLTNSQINVGGIDPNLSSPVTYNYTASVERKVVAGLVANIGYSGSRSDDLIEGGGQETATSYGTDMNRFAGDLIVNNGTTTRLNPSFGAITYAQNGAIGGYNALIAGVRGRFSHRGYFSASYTRSASKDDSQIYPTFTNLGQYYGPSAGMLPTDFRWLLATTCRDSIPARACWAESPMVGALATSLSYRAAPHSWSTRMRLISRVVTTTLTHLITIFPMWQAITRGPDGQPICREFLLPASLRRQPQLLKVTKLRTGSGAGICKHRPQPFEEYENR